jgi:hypothetical protein
MHLDKPTTTPPAGADRPTLTAFPQRVAQYFSSTYVQARERFRVAARARGSFLETFPIDALGARGEDLSTDVALIAGSGARSLLVITSATHGAEGFCGSACQLALLDDEALLAWAAEAGVALLLIHAINPFGFSWISRTNEHNIDLNRNAQSFENPLPENPDYANLHSLLVPSVWPPTVENRQAITDYIEQHGRTRYRDAVSRGQYVFSDGIFFGGNESSQSLRTLWNVLKTYGRGYADIGWIDVHTGLGPYGYGEKIFAGRPDLKEVARARRWWGQDIAVPFAGTSTSANVTGHLASVIYSACPDARHTLMGLEFGTVPFEAMVDALRGEAWLRVHPGAPPELAQSIRQTLLGAFYCDHDVWKGMVLGQSRVAIFQALRGLAANVGSGASVEL